MPLLDHRIGLRPPQIQHPIEQLARQGGFPLLGRISFRPQPVAECPFVTGKGVLGMGLRVITRCPFLGKPTFTLNLQQMLISLGRR
jgi:hypothetical protein